MSKDKDLREKIEQSIEWYKEYITGVEQGIADYDEGVLYTSIIGVLEQEVLKARIDEQQRTPMTDDARSQCGRKENRVAELTKQLDNFK